MHIKKATNVINELRKCSSLEKAKFLPRFFKAGKGEYGEGDKFIGITVPNQRLIAKKYSDLTLKEIQKLLDSKIHEHRLTALFILVKQFKKASEKAKREIYNFYLSNTNNINNWDLVDSSASYIIGIYLHENSSYLTSLRGRSFKGTEILKFLAESNILWEKRIAIVSTFELIRNNKFKETFKISKLLLGDRHDLIHKAVGWMLREVGKRDVEALESFLKNNYSQINRTTLRYAIEKFSEEKRKKFLSGLL